MARTLARKEKKKTNPAGRPSWRGMLRFSLVTIPVALHSAKVKGGGDVDFVWLHRTCHNRILDFSKYEDSYRERVLEVKPLKFAEEPAALNFMEALKKSLAKTRPDGQAEKVNGKHRRPMRHKKVS